MSDWMEDNRIRLQSVYDSKELLAPQWKCVSTRFENLHPRPQIEVDTVRRCLVHYLLTPF
jgi:hypothetical protein